MWKPGGVGLAVDAVGFIIVIVAANMKVRVSNHWSLLTSDSNDCGFDLVIATCLNTSLLLLMMMIVSLSIDLKSLHSLLSMKHRCHRLAQFLSGSFLSSKAM